MDLLKNFGIEPVLLIAQIVNFLIILLILKKFLYKPVLDVLKTREKTIKEGLEKAKEGELLLEKALDKEKQILKNAQSQSKKLLDESKDQAKDLMKQAEKNSEKQAERILTQAREQIVKETKQAEKQLSIHISKLAVDMLQKSMQDFFSEKEQEEILSKAIKRLKEQPN